MKHIFLSLIVCIILLSSNAQDVPKDYIFLYVESINGMMITSLSINGKQGNFIIDTGASTSILDINQSKKYNFDYYVDINYNYAGIGGKSKIYYIDDVEIKGLKYVHFKGADLKEVFSYFNDDGIFVIGILGNDFLNAYGAIIDYRNKTVKIKTK